ncbi:hypothetical protein [Janthinobacterium lividum]|jgi:hypothetical protein|uniref:hypothetical protein n=1 Tax=Janthinobacterium lividum TaxID=29581 RepID=UPI000873D853|nr:hypothetical protein [Janthinobacterium lividum]MCC7716642.1 hypothetical protein [Janthinobacterium lividum]OEZ64505.1 hypothetical protein JANLI_06800 [Janthinobacterium lividum]WQE31984.1 hypothetical protein U0004_29255 [Janthinobacterium lividum]STS85985.1 Uncharacterised protein [Janthinobacterium lividum]
MNVKTEISKFHALLYLVGMRFDVGVEIVYQKRLLRSLGADPEEEIHNRDARKYISTSQAKVALASVRQGAMIADTPLKRQFHISQSKYRPTPEDVFTAYLRARGK